MNLIWKNADINVVAANGPDYVTSLLYDYEHYVSIYGYVSITSFLEDWTCIPFENFIKLKKYDIVYAPNGDKYVVVNSPYNDYDNDIAYVEVQKYSDIHKGNHSTEIFTIGNLYYKRVVHDHYLWKKKTKINEEEKSICPILITETKQPQN